MLSPPIYRKVASFNTSRLDADAGFFRLRLYSSCLAKQPVRLAKPIKPFQSIIQAQPSRPVWFIHLTSTLILKKTKSEWKCQTKFDQIWVDKYESYQIVKLSKVGKTLAKKMDYSVGPHWKLISICCTLSTYDFELNAYLIISIQYGS